MRMLRSVFPLLLLFFFLLDPFQVQGQNEMLDTDNGIMGFRLGAHRDSVPMHLERSGKVQKLNRFYPYTDTLEYNGIPLHSMYLYYWHGHLHSIEVKTKGEHTTMMLGLIQALYGEGVPVANFDSQFYWEGEKVRLYFEQNIVTKDAEWNWVSDKVHKEYELALYNMKYRD